MKLTDSELALIEFAAREMMHDDCDCPVRPGLNRRIGAFHVDCQWADLAKRMAAELAERAGRANA